MSLKNLADTFVRTHAPHHLGSNIRRYEWRSYVGETHHNMLGGISYLRPLEGKVVANDDQFTLVKTGPKEFCAILSTLLSAPVSIGDKIGLRFYQLRRFDGTLADGSDDAAVNGIRRCMLTGAKSLFPVKWDGRDSVFHESFSASHTEIHNPYLRDLITQMENLGVDGGYRNFVNILVDANPKNLRFNDSPESEVVDNPPGIHVDVATAKFTGHVEINYDRVMDYYRIVLTPNVGDVIKIDDVSFDELGTCLIDHIDDRSWIQAKVEVIKAAPKVRAKPPVSA